MPHSECRGDHLWSCQWPDETGRSINELGSHLKKDWANRNQMVDSNNLLGSPHCATLEGAREVNLNWCICSHPFNIPIVYLQHCLSPWEFQIRMLS